MGRARYVVFYLLAGVAATLAQTAVTLGTPGRRGGPDPERRRERRDRRRDGRLHRPLPARAGHDARRHHPDPDPGALVPRPLVRVPALDRQLLGAASPQEGGGVAFFAHVGGFVFGAAGVHLFARRRRRWRGAGVDVRGSRPRRARRAPARARGGAAERRGRRRGREPRRSRPLRALRRDLADRRRPRRGRAAEPHRDLPAAARGGLPRPRASSSARSASRSSTSSATTSGSTRIGSPSSATTDVLEAHVGAFAAAGLRGHRDLLHAIFTKD